MDNITYTQLGQGNGALPPVAPAPSAPPRGVGQSSHLEQSGAHPSSPQANGGGESEMSWGSAHSTYSALISLSHSLLICGVSNSLWLHCKYTRKRGVVLYF